MSREPKVRFVSPIRTERRSGKYRTAVRHTANLVTPKNQQDQVNSYLDQYTCCPPPIFIILVSLVEIGVFIYYTLTTDANVTWFGGCPGCRIDGKNGPLLFTPTKRQQAWRFTSYMLLHSGIEHLAGNVLMQILLGVPLELVHKMWRVALLYLIGVAMGSTIHYIVDPTVALVGASGGVYALIVAHLANVIINWVEMPLRWVRLSLIGAFLSFDIGHAVYRRFGLDQCLQVSYAAHVGGAITGLLLGLLLLRNIKVHKWEKVIIVIATVAFVIIAACAVIMVIVVEPNQPLIITKC